MKGGEFALLSSLAKQTGFYNRDRITCRVLIGKVWEQDGKNIPDSAAVSYRITSLHQMDSMLGFVWICNVFLCWLLAISSV